MGFDAWFFARMDTTDAQDQCKEDKKTTEWIQYPNGDRLGSQNSIFTHYMFQGYGGIMNFDFFCDDGIVTDKSSPSFNADTISETFLVNVR